MQSSLCGIPFVEFHKVSTMKKIVVQIAQVVVGLIFLVSAFAKAWGGNAFANLVTQYGANWLSVGVPFLIATETGLAAMLLLRIRTKTVSLCSAIFVFCISLVYLYGVVVKGITDCGCFGSLHALNMRPIATFIRNIILIALCLLGFFWGNNQKSCVWWKVGTMIVLIASSMFICGLDMSKGFQLPQFASLQRKANLKVEDSTLGEILPLSPDSSYAVYLFSYSCVFCQNSFANVEQYQRIQEVDKVYGVAIDNPEKEERFRNLYQPTIPVYNIPEDTMQRLVGELPVLLLIKNGEIVHKEVGSVLSPFLRIQ